MVKGYSDLNSFQQRGHLSNWAVGASWNLNGNWVTYGAHNISDYLQGWRHNPCLQGWVHSNEDNYVYNRYGFSSQFITRSLNSFRFHICKLMSRVIHLFLMKTFLSYLYLSYVRTIESYVVKYVFQTWVEQISNMVQLGSIVQEPFKISVKN